MDNYNTCAACTIYLELVPLLSLLRPDFCPDDIKVGYYLDKGSKGPMTAVIWEGHGSRVYSGNVYRMPYAERMTMVEHAAMWLSTLA